MNRADRLSDRHGKWVGRCLAQGELAPLDGEDVHELVALLTEHSFTAGSTLLRSGDRTTQVHIIRDGLVELSKDVGRRRIVLQVLRPGDVLGDVAMLMGLTEPFDARVLTDSVILSIDSAALLRLLARHPRVAHRWLISMAGRMATVQARLVDLLAHGLEARVAALLSREAHHGVVRLSQQVLAELLGARRTSVNRILKRLEDRGLIRVGYGQVDILDPSRLVVVAVGADESQ